jgi:uncharacterized protein (TIGR03067 family)
MMRAIALFVFATGLLSLVDDPKPDDVKKEFEALSGTWKITKMELEGKDLLANFGEVEAEIKDKELTSPGIAADLKLDPSKKPKAIDLSYTEGPSAGKTVKGIYKLDGDTLAICRALKEEDERPTEFSAPADSGKMLFEFKRK